MRLNMRGSAPSAAAARLVVAGVIDWSTIGQFQVVLSRYLLPPQPDVLVDLTGLLSWSRQAQMMLAGAIWNVHLRGGRLTMTGLQAIPRWQAKDSGLPGLDPGPDGGPAAWHVPGGIPPRLPAPRQPPAGRPGPCRVPGGGGAVADRRTPVRLPTLALMSRRFAMTPTGTSTTLAGRFVRDTCRNWGVPDDHTGEAAAVVRALAHGVPPDSGAVHLIMEARGDTVTVRICHQDQEPGPVTPGSRRNIEVTEYTTGAWTVMSSQDSDQKWAVVARDQHPLPGSGR